MRVRSIVRNYFVLIGEIASTAVSALGSFALRLFGLYRRLWIYARTRELRLITTAAAQAGNAQAIIDLPDELIPGSCIREASQPDITFVI
jgi:hypothetical protein